MQKFILSKKNHIALISAILIAIGFTSALGFKNEFVAVLALAIASLLGVAPIAIQAYQALKVKVVTLMFCYHCRSRSLSHQKLRRIGHCHLPVLIRGLLGAAHLK